MKLSRYKWYRKLLKGKWYQNRYILKEGVKVKWERKGYKFKSSKKVCTLNIEEYKKSFQLQNNKKD